jgi:predicted O-linked N-acetylglucosamine transferase (SPINDLY family)
MGKNNGQRAFHNIRSKKQQKAELAQLLERAAALQRAGLLPEAQAIYRQLLKLAPRHFDALYMLGMSELQARSYREAEVHLGQAADVEPRSAKAHLNRGAALFELKRLDEAGVCYRRAIALDPGYALALNNLGNVCLMLRRLDEAIENYDKALAIRPDFPDAWYNRGLVLTQLRRYQEAVASHDRALALAPALAGAWVGRGQALQSSKRSAEAMASCERALSIDPRSYRAHALMGHCLAALGRVDEAIGKFDDALAIKPDLEDAISQKIFVADFVADLSFAQQRDLRRVWWEQVGSKIAALPREPHRHGRDPQRRLVLGYVSSDFYHHSAALAFRPVLQYSDKAQFETVCYSCSPFKDAVTEEFRQLADRWRDASQWTDQHLAAQIRQDGVDILIDLSGHTDGNRLAVFARKPAPIQVHGWGHCTPPGLPTIDYVFSDSVTIPPPVRDLFQEAIWDLPCVMTLDPLPADVSRAELPALANGFVTFGVFNRISKISDDAAEAWARILGRVPHSKLLVKHNALEDQLVRDHLLARFARHGVPADRIDLLGNTTRSDHLMALNGVDISLDPFPQNGGVSTWEALQMGVPVVAKLGGALPGRLSGGILSAVGMPQWVADSAEDYVEIAVAHASRLDELAALRRALPGRVAATAAGNPAAYANEVAKAYRRMWQIYCDKRDD